MKHKINLLQINRMFLINDSFLVVDKLVFENKIKDKFFSGEVNDNYDGLIGSNNPSSHYQSYFLCIQNKIIIAFINYFIENKMPKNHQEAIYTYEIELSKIFLNKNKNYNELFYDKNPPAYYPHYIIDNYGIIKRQHLLHTYEKSINMTDDNLAILKDKYISNIEIFNYIFTHTNLISSSKTQNIIHITHNFGGGSQVYIDNLCESLKNNTHVQISFTEYNDNVNYCNEDIIILHHFIYIKNGIFYTIKKIIDILNKKKPKKLIFIVHDYFLLFPQTPNPIKNTLQEPLLENIIFTKYVFKIVDMVIFNSNNTFSNYTKYIGYDFKYIITNSTPDIFLIPNKEITLIKKTIYTIGILGHIDYLHKGKNLLIKFIEMLPKDKYNFKIFGPEKNSFMYDNVMCFGEYKNKDIFNIIYENNIDCFLFVSLFEETYSYTLSIAINTGLPIFYNNIGSYPERLKNRTNCFAYDEDLINSFDSNIEKCINKGNNINKYKINYNIDCNIADFQWVLNDNNSIIFDVNIIKQNLFHNNVCFIHFTNIGDGYKILLDQISTIKNSGLYDKLDFIFITILGPHIKLYNDNKIKVIYYSDNNLEWEFPTIKRIKYFSDNIGSKVNILYIHTKGTLNKPYSYEWRKYLEYFLIENFNNCLNLLKEYECIGVNMQIYDKLGPNKLRNHFSGNFWWSNTNYIRTLSNIDDKIANSDRYYSEHFIIGNYHSIDSNKFISLHQTKFNLYEHAIQKEEYSYEIIKKNIIKSFNLYNTEKYKPIIGIYYISAQNNYEYRLNTQLELLVKSGLYDNMMQLVCFVSGIHADNVCKLLEQYKKIKIISTKENKYEIFAISSFKEHINIKNDYNIFYIHTKGISHNIDNIPINDWCNLCNHFTINLWKLNVMLLRYYDTCGINLLNYPKKHYSGNYWWTTSKHLQTLGLIGDKYLDPEMYILNSYNVNSISIYTSIIGHATTIYPSDNYINLSVDDILSNINCNPFYNIGDNNTINNSRISW